MKLQRLRNAVHISLYLQFEASEHLAVFIEATISMHVIEDVCWIMTRCLVHKVINLKESQYFSEIFSYRREVANRQPRHGGRLHYPKVMA